MALGVSPSMALALAGFCFSLLFIAFVCSRLACALLRRHRRARARLGLAAVLPHYATDYAFAGGGGGGLGPAAVAALPTRDFAAQSRGSGADPHGYVWKYASASPVLTTEGYQAKLLVFKKQSAGPGRPSLVVLSRPSGRPAEAMESVLCTALAYIDDVCGCRIGDLDYAKCFQRRFRLHNPGLFPGAA